MDKKNIDIKVKNFLPHLNTQTNSNVGFSLLKINDLINFCLKNDLKFLAISDYYPYEIVNFFNSCKKNKIKPIFGMKFFINDDSEKFNNDSKLIIANVYPKNNIGYKEVIKKLFSENSSLFEKDNNFNDRIFSYEIINSFSNNVIIILEARKIEEINFFYNKWIKREKKNNLFIGLTFFLFSPRKGIIEEGAISKIIPFFSVKVLDDEGIEILNILRRTPFSKKFTDFSIHSSSIDDFISYVELGKYFSICTDDKTFYYLMINQWKSLLEEIDLKLSFFKKKRMVDKNSKEIIELERKCLQKLISLKKNENEERLYQNRLEKELEIVKLTGYTNYLLNFSEIVELLKKKKILIGPGRGSSISSLIVYLLGITSIDPLKHNLFFERFLNEKRNVDPDIDLDVDSQQEVFDYISENYLSSRIITRKKIGMKRSLKELSFFFRIPSDVLLLIEKKTKDDLSSFTFVKKIYPVFFKFSEIISDLYYDVGIHPSGIIIFEKKITYSLIPFKINREKKSYPISLFDWNEIVNLDVKKYDFLSLKDAFLIISSNSILNLKEKKFNFNFPNYDNIDINDKKTWNLLKNFLLTDIFQLDTQSARQLFVKFNPNNFSDLSIFLGLNRPGVRKGFLGILESKNNENSINFRFDSVVLRNILRETYGFIVFEEQISIILSLIYEINLSEAEIRRRKILKEKKIEDNFFIESRKKFSEKDSLLLNKMIKEVITNGYTFNKSHSIGYSYFVYYISYLKANFFSDVIIELLNKKDKKNIFQYLQESTFFDFKIKKPDVNYSFFNWEKDKNFLIAGFSFLKRGNEKFFKNLIEERINNGKYKDWKDFSIRTYTFWENSDLNNLSVLISSGIFDSLNIDSEILLKEKENIIRCINLMKKMPGSENVLPFINLLKPHKNNDLLFENKDDDHLIKKVKKEEKDRLKIILENKIEFENFNFPFGFFSRWNEIKKNNDIIPFIEIYQKRVFDEDIFFKVYSLIIKVEEKDNSRVIFFQDVRNQFRLVINKSFYQVNKNKILENNEIFLSLRIRISKKFDISLSCEKIDEISFFNN